ncbi:MAG: transcription antitermination factor NusB [Acetobacteraceae bacterium]|nr:transcription antitermination factor NusB [Acetobacteraceae bacterium]
MRSLQEAYEQLKAAGDRPTPKAALSARERRARTVARLAAVQALYQMELGGAGVEAVIREFGDYRFERDMEGAELAEADEAYFADVVRDAVSAQAEVDRAIAVRLAKNWRLERIDATLRAILRAGATELIKRPDTPLEVVIDEYVEIAKSFFEGPEPGFVNGALDGIAQDVRG